MNLNELRDEAYSVAKANGWHEQEHRDEHYLMLIITEIAEAVQADRSGKWAFVESYHERLGWYDEKKKGWEHQKMLAYKYHIKNSVEDELADVIIRLLDFAGLKGIDVETFDVDMANRYFPEECFYICKILSDAYGELRPMAVSYIISEMMAYCASKGIDIIWFIQKKMEYNKTRPYKHGKAY